MPVALSSETLINTVTTDGQSAADLAANVAGVSAVAWLDASGGASVAKLRLFGADGTPITAEIVLGAARDVQVAALETGGFVAVTLEAVGLVRTVKAQLFDALGAAVGEPKVLQHDASAPNTPTLGLGGSDLEVIGLEDGGFAATWVATRWDSMGFTYQDVKVVVADGRGVVEGERTISISGDKVPGDPQPALAQLGDGSVLLTWTPDFSPTTPTRQAAQLLDAQGAPKGGVFQMGEAGYADSLAVLADGDVAVVWPSAGVTYAAVYSGAALAQGLWTRLSEAQTVGASASDGEPEVAALPDGGFAVTWTTAGQVGERDVMARFYTADGDAVGPAFRLGEVSAGSQAGPSVAGLPSGGLIAVWTDASGQGGDASGSAVKGQIVWPGVAQAGTAAGDSMVGGGGDDAFAGLEGADTLRGGGGLDTLAGGPGADLFVLSADGAPDRIIDFSGASGDRLDLRDAQGLAVQDGILILDRATGRLTWDPDSDAGAALPTLIGEIDARGFDRDDFADGVRPDGVRVLLANGGKAETVFDWGQERFDQTTSTFDAQGRVTTYFVKNDDGTTGQRWWDVQATQPWSTRAAEYAADGQLKAYAVTYEDGHTEVFQFDVTDSQAWTRNVDFYDALGRQSVQAVAFDDGTAFERHVDTYDVQPWAYYIDNYKNGSLLNHTYYREDGSVWVG